MTFSLNAGAASSEILNIVRALSELNSELKLVASSALAAKRAIPYADVLASRKPGDLTIQPPFPTTSDPNPTKNTRPFLSLNPSFKLCLVR